MLARPLILSAGFGLCLACLATAADAEDATVCLTTAERVEAGETLTEAERDKAHRACMQALSDTASVVQKYQFQEADFAIMAEKRKD